MNDRITVTFRLRGREYKDRFFVNLEATQIEKMGSDAPSETGSLEPEQTWADAEPPF